MKYQVYKHRDGEGWWVIKEDHYWHSTRNTWTRCTNVHRGLDVEAHLVFISEFETEECPYVYAEMLMLLES